MTTDIPIDFNVLSSGAVRDTQQLTNAVSQLGRETRGTRGELTETSRTATDTRSSFSRLRGSLGALRAGFIGLGITAVAATFVKLTDRTIALQNRLRPLVDSTAELTEAYELLDDIALRSQTTTETTVELFARLRVATRDLGLDLQETADLTETLSQLQRVTVSSSEEATNALRQFAQGLASGRLSGDELRSVLENLPDLARIIADELGVTIGALRDLGAEGQLSSDVLIRALGNAKDEIAELANDQVPSATRGFSVLTDQLLDLGSRFATAVSDGASLGEVLIELAELIDSLDDTATTVGLRVGAAFSVIGNSVELANESVKSFGNALGALLTDRTLEDVRREFLAIRDVIVQDLNAAIVTLFASNEELLRGAEETGLEIGKSIQRGVKEGLEERPIPAIPVRRPDLREFYSDLAEDLEEIQREQDETELDRINQREQDKLAIIRSAAERGLITEAEAQQRSTTIQQQALAQRLGLLRGFTAGLAQQFEEVEGLGQAFFVANKAVAIAEATINTAQAVTKALSSVPFPLNIAAAAITAATGAVQIAAITATAIQGLQTGGEVRRLQGGGFVPGSGSGDRVPALLEPGEIVINRQAASRFRGPLLALNSNTPRFGAQAMEGSTAGRNRTTEGPVYNIDARGADLGTIARIETVLANQQEQIDNTNRRVQEARRNDPRFFSQ